LDGGADIVEVPVAEVPVAEVLAAEVLAAEVLAAEVLAAEVLAAEVLAAEVLAAEVLAAEVLVAEVLDTLEALGDAAFEFLAAEVFVPVELLEPFLVGLQVGDEVERSPGPGGLGDEDFGELEFAFGPGAIGAADGQDESLEPVVVGFSEGHDEDGPGFGGEAGAGIGAAEPLLGLGGELVWL
jgi:hypothetical protein